MITYFRSTIQGDTYNFNAVGGSVPANFPQVRDFFAIKGAPGGRELHDGNLSVFCDSAWFPPRRAMNDVCSSVGVADSTAAELRFASPNR